MKNPLDIPKIVLPLSSLTLKTFKNMREIKTNKMDWTVQETEVNKNKMTKIKENPSTGLYCYRREWLDTACASPRTTDTSTRRLNGISTTGSPSPSVKKIQNNFGISGLFS